VDNSNLSELGELCWNLASLHQLEAEERRSCRSWHALKLTMGGQTVAARLHCEGDLEVLGIRKKIQRHCKRRHIA
jgi:hypothetical protein